MKGMVWFLWVLFCACVFFFGLDAWTHHPPVWQIVCECAAMVPGFWIARRCTRQVKEIEALKAEIFSDHGKEASVTETDCAVCAVSSFSDNPPAREAIGVLVLVKRVGLPLVIDGLCGVHAALLERYSNGEGKKS